MKKDLKLKPIQLTRKSKSLVDAWMYEDTSGLQVYGQGENFSTVLTIPLSSIRAYLRRLDKGKKKSLSGGGK